MSEHDHGERWNQPFTDDEYADWSLRVIEPHEGCGFDDAYRLGLTIDDLSTRLAAVERERDRYMIEAGQDPECPRCVSGVCSQHQPMIGQRDNVIAEADLMRPVVEAAKEALRVRTEVEMHGSVIDRAEAELCWAIQDYLAATDAT